MGIADKKKGVPEGIWSKCAACNQIIYQKEFLDAHKVCPNCKFHYQLHAHERINSLIDAGTFQEMDAGLLPSDPLRFSGNKTYAESIEQSAQSANLSEAVVTGKGELAGQPVVIAVLAFQFIGGSMGSVVGEKITRAIEEAIKTNTPFIAVVASGGARMQEGIFSLMQMAKTSAAVACLAEKRLPYVSILTHPTTGGVLASFACLADLIIAEPGSYIGFTGTRVIEQTIRQKLPDGFQTAEFMMEHGMVDMVMDRTKIKDTVATYLKMTTMQPKRPDPIMKALVPDMPIANELTKQMQDTVKKGTKKVSKTVKHGTKSVARNVKKLSDKVRGD